MTAIQALDHARSSSRVSWQPRMRSQMDIACTHSITNFEAGRGLRGPLIGAAHQRCTHLVRTQRRARQGLGRSLGMAAGQFSSADEACLQKQRLRPQMPFPVIGAGEVNLRRQTFDAIAPLVDVPDARRHQRPADSHYAALPDIVKRRLVGWRHHGAKAVHAAHIVDAVHGVHPILRQNWLSAVAGEFNEQPLTLSLSQRERERWGASVPSPVGRRTG